jgi:hypothetical protein
MAVNRATDKPLSSTIYPPDRFHFVQLDRQPTPGSVKPAEERAQASFDAAMARAKRLDARSDRPRWRAVTTLRSTTKSHRLHASHRRARDHRPGDCGC